MRVLIAGSFWSASIEQMYARAFESIGWKVTCFDIDRYVFPRFLTRPFLRKALSGIIEKQISAALNTEITTSRPDLVFIIKGLEIGPGTVVSAKKLLGGRPVVNFDPDSPWERQNSSKRLRTALVNYDYNFTWSRELIPSFIECGSKNTLFLPFAYDPFLHSPPPVGEEAKNIDFDAVFIGSYDSHRDKLLAKLQGLRIGIWGNGWERAKSVPGEWIHTPAIYGGQARQIMNRSLCTINILRPQNAGSHNMRTFEVPAMRQAMLTDRTPEQLQFFSEPREMLCFESVEELREQIMRLKANRNLSSEIAEAGYERVKGETYAKRAGQILSTLGFQ